MCGIAGVFEHGRAAGGVDEALLARMRETLHHRGPDGKGRVHQPRPAGSAWRTAALANPVCVPPTPSAAWPEPQGIKVVLAGAGADELYWGYAGYQSIVERWRRFQLILALPRPVRQLAVLTSSRRVPHRREQLEGVAAGRLNPIHMPIGHTPP